MKARAARAREASAAHRCARHVGKGEGFTATMRRRLPPGNEKRTTPLGAGRRRRGAVQNADFSNTYDAAAATLISAFPTIRVVRQQDQRARRSPARVAPCRCARTHGRRRGQNSGDRTHAGSHSQGGGLLATMTMLMLDGRAPCTILLPPSPPSMMRAHAARLIAARPARIQIQDSRCS